MNGYVAGGWGATAGMLGLYAWWLIHRGRVLTRALPPEPPATAATGVRPDAPAEVRAWP